MILDKITAEEVADMLEDDEESACECCGESVDRDSSIFVVTYADDTSPMGLTTSMACEDCTFELESGERIARTPKGMLS